MSDLFKQGAEVLYRASEIIRNPEKWCTGMEAMTPDRDLTHARDPNAVCWCLVGAIKCASGTNDLAADFAQEAVRAMLLNEDSAEAELTAWNDNPYRLHGEVVALLESVADALDDLAHGRPPRPARIY